MFKEQINRFGIRTKESKNVNPFISTYNGIGYTLDNGNSYNGFLADEIFKYVTKKNYFFELVFFYLHIFSRFSVLIII